LGLTKGELAIVVAELFSQVDVAIKPVSLAIMKLRTKDWNSIHSFNVKTDVLSTCKEVFYVLARGEKAHT
jgi:hypothetical protein